LTRNYLSLAAASLEKNNPERGCLHLARYIDANPDQLLIRARYAELLLRLGRFAEARSQFEELVCSSQDHPGPAAPDRIHSHSRLMEIAEQCKDLYNEHLHRGIGLYLLARERSTLSDAEQRLPPESLLFKAAGELTLAQLQLPDEARPCWYLYQVWSRLGQRQPALCRLRQADAAAPFTFLTPAERFALQLACEREFAATR
jgi:tetratricopeptide (TPR) repeat protein